MSIPSLAQRLSVLNARSPEQAGLLTYAIGAVLCAHEAHRSGFSDLVAHPKRWRNELDGALVAAKQISLGKSPSTSAWTAVVHFNGALLRIDAGFERAVRYITRSRARSYPLLRKAAEKHGIGSRPLDHWHRVRCGEANRLKHQSQGGLAHDRLTFRAMLAALDALVGMLEKHASS